MTMETHHQVPNRFLADLNGEVDLGKHACRGMVNALARAT